MENTILMMKDTPVLRFNFDTGLYEVLCDSLLPFELKNRILPPLPEKEVYTKSDLTEQLLWGQKNQTATMDFLSQRVLPISRTNAKKIYGLFGFEQLQDEFSKTKIALACRAVSLQDNYWTKEEREPCRWCDVNLRENHLNEVVTKVSLYGSSLSLTGALITPELTGQGAYAKAWIREPDGLYLHKRGANGSWESEVEVMVSNLLDRCNVPHVKYEASMSYDTQIGEAVYTCKCLCMTSESVSILPGRDFTGYCRIQGLNPQKEALRIDADMMYKMWIVDYLVSNRDRHGQNWGFFYNCNTMEILGCHPLFDHNNSFDIPLMRDKDAPYLYDQSMTMQQAAKLAMDKVDFHFTEPITRDMFLTDLQFQSFTERARELNIRTMEQERAIE